MTFILWNLIICQHDMYRHAEELHFAKAVAGDNDGLKILLLSNMIPKNVILRHRWVIEWAIK